ncbi:hypothetical protein CR513_12685, partial [Mucuna pruriens]
ALQILLPHFGFEPSHGTSNVMQMVKESMSPSAMLVILIPKKDCTWRMYIDFKPINNITIRYRHPIPPLDDLLDKLHGFVIFSKIDLQSGYH